MSAHGVSLPPPDGWITGSTVVLEPTGPDPSPTTVVLAPSTGVDPADVVVSPVPTLPESTVVLTDPPFAVVDTAAPGTVVVKPGTVAGGNVLGVGGGLLLQVMGMN